MGVSLQVGQNPIVLMKGIDVLTYNINSHYQRTDVEKVIYQISKIIFLAFNYWFIGNHDV